MLVRRSAPLGLLVVAFLTAAVPSEGAVKFRYSHKLETVPEDPGVGRLPGNVFPKRYTIKLEPRIGPDEFGFKGEVEIEINVRRVTSMIVLHAASLDIEGQYTKLLHANGSEVNVVMRPAYDADVNFYKLKLSSCVLEGDYILRMKYSGLLHDDMRGFYRDSYLNDRNETSWFATTLFQPTFARRAFPCFDEPSYKATFKIFIIHSNTHKAISNMPAVDGSMPSQDPTKIITEFQETPKMSTFLVAFSVSDFHYYSLPDGTFRIFARKNKLKMTRFAVSMGPKVLTELAKYTNIDYKLPKIDNFVTPRSSAPGMENWGLVTYRESALLYDEGRTTTEAKHKIVNLLSHEFAHQWFGNLVTPSWWSSIWLSEGFAKYFEYWITDKLEPSWRMMDQFVIENLQEKAFNADDNEEAQHPMEITMALDDPNQVMKAAFNPVSYYKASCVIRMFAHVLAPNVFQTGLRNYLKNKSYQVVTSNDLIRELAAVSRDIEFVDKALISWITQPGYPLVTVTQDSGNAVISQKRFLPKSQDVRKEQWFVPINFVTEEEPARFSETRPTHWLLNDTKQLIIPGLKNDKWIILNSQQTGYYRVNYDARNWQLIINYLKDPSTMKNIHVLNRAQLLDDAFHLAEAGELPDHSIFLEMTNYLQHEEDFVPWYAAHRAFSTFDKVLMNTAVYDRYKLYIQRLIAKLEEKLGYTEKDNESDDVKMARPDLMKLACAMGSAKCLNAAFNMMLTQVYEYEKASADLQNIVLCAGMRSVNKNEWDKAYDYTSGLSRDSDEYRILTNALGCSTNPEILKAFLEKGFFTASDDEYANDVLDSVLNGDPAAVDAILAFTKDKFESFIEYYGPDAIETILTSNADRMTTHEQLARLQDFIDTLPAEHQELAKKLRNGAVSKASKNIKLAEKYVETAAKFLNAQHLVGE